MRILKSLCIVSAVATLFCASTLRATTINQASSALAGDPNVVLVTFDQDGSGTPLPKNIGTDCFTPPNENCTLPANEYAGYGVTLLPTTRVSEDNSACFRSLVELGGSGAFGLIATDTDEMLFDPPISAFEFWVVAPSSHNLQFTTYDQNDQMIEQTSTFFVTATSCGFTAVRTGYFGVSSTVPIYRVEVSANSGILDQLRMVPVATEVDDLTLASNCTYDPDIDRSWTIGNPNDFDVDVTWQIDGSAQTGMLTVPAGDTQLVTTTEPMSDNVLTIMWNDETSAQVTTSLASEGIACDDDSDGLPNKDEDAIGTDSNNPDTDGDGLLDGEEVGLAAGNGCPDPLSYDSDGDGVSDGADNNVCNAPPAADIVVEQLTNIGAQALVRLDGLGTSDDDPITDLNFVWLVDGNTVCDGDNTTCSSIEYLLSYGDHEVTLIVTDSDGDSGSATTFVNLDPAQLSVLEIDFASINFSTSRPRINLIGEIGLPFGVDYSELNPIATLGVDLSTIGVLGPTDITLTSLGCNERKWRYDNSNGPIRSFDINWRGTRFLYREHHFPITIKSRMITSAEAVVSVSYKRRQIGNGFVIDFGNGATLTVDQNGNATSTVDMDVDRPRRQVSLTLPFPITNESQFTISGFASRTIDASQYLQASVGRFLLVAEFDPSLVPDGADNSDPAIDFYLTVGDEAYYSGTGLGASSIASFGNRWISFGND